MIVQIDIEDEQSMNAAFQCFDEPRNDRAMSRMREVVKTLVAAFEIHHEAIGKVQTVSFWRDVWSALKVRKCDLRYFHKPPDLLEEGEATVRRHFTAESA
ncbi:hypothetical protein J2802_002874 [Paraburkholderia caribensis]|jgi:hypothetical protein|nr:MULTISPECIES: hypothetical protein [Paraburkholderia]MDR6382454.1 hypothetical protein [Paraburkholderia caribensis]